MGLGDCSVVIVLYVSTGTKFWISRTLVHAEWTVGLTCNFILGRWKQDAHRNLMSKTSHISELWVFL